MTITGHSIPEKLKAEQAKPVRTKYDKEMIKVAKTNLGKH